METRECLIRAVRLDPLDLAGRAALADCLEQAGETGPAAALRRDRLPLWEIDRRAIALLWQCTLPPGSFDKRFARDMAHKVVSGEAVDLTPKQYRCLWKLAWKYRRQIREEQVVLEAGWIRENSHGVACALGTELRPVQHQVSRQAWPFDGH